MLPAVRLSDATLPDQHIPIGMNYEQLVTAIDDTTRALLGRAAQAVNQALVVRNWLIGHHLVEFEQSGEDRARYGEKLLSNLASDLKGKGLKGLGVTALQSCRQFYRTYPGIQQSVTGELRAILPGGQIRHSVTGELSGPPIHHTPSGESAALPPDNLLRLSWTHIVELVRIDDPLKRSFYEVECVRGNWSVRQLQRQIGSLLFERTGLSKDKEAVIRRADRQEPPATIEAQLRDPYVLEFAGLAERPSYTESELETALLDHLQAFLLELGNGFCFEARQKRITIGDQHDYVDLVFYHRVLRCHVLVDLKIRPFSHGDVGQMNFYLNYFKQRIMEADDNPPVGIILCSDRNKTKVEYATAGLDNQLFVSRYLTAMPSVDQLRKVIQQDREAIENSMREDQG
jgi:predicted nuclease of restriction endonuclease-like (RecB) superfamily